eukprot:1194842-Prorocentrum_minimum.AAC.2
MIPFSGSTEQALLDMPEDDVDMYCSEMGERSGRKWGTGHRALKCWLYQPNEFSKMLSSPPGTKTTTPI